MKNILFVITMLLLPVFSYSQIRIGLGENPFKNEKVVTSDSKYLIRVSTKVRSLKNIKKLIDIGLTLSEREKVFSKIKKQKGRKYASAENFTFERKINISKEEVDEAIQFFQKENPLIPFDVGKTTSIKKAIEKIEALGFYVIMKI